MRIFTNEVKVGLVVVIAIAFFVILVSTVGNFGKLWGTEELLVRMESVAGLTNYASVTFAGKKIGVIEKIELQKMGRKTWAVLTCSIHEPAHIVLDATAHVAQSSLLGEPYLEISAGTHPVCITDATTKPWVLNGVPVTTFDQMFAAVNRISGQVEDILQDVKQISGNEDLRTSVETTVEQIEETVEEIRSTAVSIRTVVSEATPTIRYLFERGKNAADNIDAAVLKIREGAEDVPDLITDLRTRISDLTEKAKELIAQGEKLLRDSEPKVQSTLDNVSELAEQLRVDADALAKDIRDLASHVDTVVVENQGDVRILMDELRVAAGHLASLARQLDEHPWRAIWKTEGRLEPPSITPDWEPEIERRSNQ